MGRGASKLGGNVLPKWTQASVDKINKKFSVGNQGRKGTVTGQPTFQKLADGRIQFTVPEEQYYMGQKSVTMGVGDIPGAYRTYSTTGFIIQNGNSSQIFGIQTKKTNERSLSLSLTASKSW